MREQDGQETSFVGNILSSSLTFMAILIGVVAVLFSQYQEFENIHTFAFVVRLLIYFAIILVILSGVNSLLSLLYLRGISIPEKLISYMLGIIIIFVIVGIISWTYVTIKVL